MVSRVVLIVFIAGFLGACAGSPVEPEPYPGGAPSAGKEPSVSKKSSAEKESTSAASAKATASLLQKARSASSRGEQDQAQALLERAQRIDSRNAAIYLELARLHRDRGDAAEARTMAERGMLYCDQRTCRQLKKYLQ